MKGGAPDQKVVDEISNLMKGEKLSDSAIKVLFLKIIAAEWCMTTWLREYLCD